MSQDVNLIITCDHTTCSHNCEGECGKETLLIDDPDCIAQTESSSSDEVMEHYKKVCAYHNRKAGLRNDKRNI